MSTKAWCCTAAFSENGVTINRISDGTTEGTQVDGDPLKDRQLDLSSAPDWMEFIEIQEQRQNQNGGAGAYDTMRADLRIGTAISNQKWYIWGQDFHLVRIQKSFLSLFDEEFTSAKDTQSYIVNGVTISWNDALQRAHQMSKDILQSLLIEAEESSKMWTLPDSISLRRRAVYMVRLTLLWSQDRNFEHADNIVVRGHACSSMVPTFMDVPAPAIECCIAAEVYHDSNGSRMVPMIGAALPSRYHNPQNKVASWTRLRKQLEEPEKYKPPSVSEVIMVRSMASEGGHLTNSDLEILEGLSSNVFFIYSDGTLRTPVDGVLHGYVRQLVLDCAHSCDLMVVLSQPIGLQEVQQWKEVFITSSSRLLYPVSKILIQHRLLGGEQVFREFWCDPSLSAAQETNHKKPKWQDIYETILQRADYE